MFAQVRLARRRAGPIGLGDPSLCLLEIYNAHLSTSGYYNAHLPASGYGGYEWW